MTKATLDERFKRIEDYLIGVWRFRVRNQPALWAGTFVFEGHYYDVSGKKSPGAVLDAIHREVSLLKKIQRRRLQETVNRIDETQERVFITLPNRRKIVILSGREYDGLVKGRSRKVRTKPAA
jgi:hypothetical protein